MTATIQIPNLPAVIALNGTEQFETVQSGVSARVTLDQILAYVETAFMPVTFPVARVAIAADSSLTRPANVTAYAANQGVGSGSTCIFKWTNFFSASGSKTGLLTGLRVVAAAASIGVANMPNLLAHLYTTTPGSPPASDQATFNDLTANQVIELGTVAFGQWNIGGAGSNMIDSYGAPVIVPLPIRPADGERDLYIVLATTSTATPIASTVVSMYASLLET